MYESGSVNIGVFHEYVAIYSGITANIAYATRTHGGDDARRRVIHVREGTDSSRAAIVMALNNVLHQFLIGNKCD
jgi:hypothetical protein